MKVTLAYPPQGLMAALALMLSCASYPTGFDFLKAKGFDTPWFALVRIGDTVKSIEEDRIPELMSVLRESERIEDRPIVPTLTISLAIGASFASQGIDIEVGEDGDMAIDHVGERFCFHCARLPSFAQAAFNQSTDVQLPPITAVELSANSSFGQDWWRVVYRDDHSCEWIGNEQTDRKGNYIGVLDTMQWARVMTCIEFYGLEQLPAHLDDPNAHDARHLVLTVHRGDVSKTIDEYNNAGPGYMRTAESKLLQVADEVAWHERPQ